MISRTWVCNNWVEDQYVKHLCKLMALSRTLQYATVMEELDANC